METLHAKASIFINRPINRTFEFLCDPRVDPTELTPLEEHVTERSQTVGVGFVCRATIELAARELSCETRCIELEPPHRLVTRLEGDLEATQVWELAPEEEGTRAELSIEIIAPKWLPAYLRDETTAARWTKVLAEQTLAKLKASLEESYPPF
jgi:uncharacterized protein YndB with AHSA1/START domain